MAKVTVKKGLLDYKVIWKDLPLLLSYGYIVLIVGSILEQWLLVAGFGFWSPVLYGIFDYLNVSAFDLGILTFSTIASILVTVDMTRQDYRNRNQILKKSVKIRIVSYLMLILACSIVFTLCYIVKDINIVSSILVTCLLPLFYFLRDHVSYKSIVTIALISFFVLCIATAFDRIASIRKNVCQSYDFTIDTEVKKDLCVISKSSSYFILFDKTEKKAFAVEASTVKRIEPTPK